MPQAAPRKNKTRPDPITVCAASACVLVGFTSERATSFAFDSTCCGGGAGSTEACGVGCAELEVLIASHDMSWPICAFPGLCAVTVEPPPGALRRDGNAQRMLRNVRISHAAGAVMEGCVWWVQLQTQKIELRLEEPYMVTLKP